MSKATVFGRVVRRFRNPLATRLSAASVKVRRSGTSAIHPSLPVRRHPAAQAFIPAIAIFRGLGLPRARLGSPDECRHGRLGLVFYALRCRQCQCGQPELQLDGREPAEQQCAC